MKKWVQFPGLVSGTYVCYLPTEITGTKGGQLNNRTKSHEYRRGNYFCFDTYQLEYQYVSPLYMVSVIYYYFYLNNINFLYFHKNLKLNNLEKLLINPYPIKIKVCFYWYKMHSRLHCMHIRKFDFSNTKRTSMQRVDNYLVK